jgi:hypothetical protein
LLANQAMSRYHYHSGLFPALVTIITIYLAVLLLEVQNHSSSASANNLSFGSGSDNSSSTSEAGIPRASSIYDTQTMIIPSASVKSAIITIVDESHEPPKSSHKHISDRNSYLLPTNLAILQGVSLSFLDADAPWDSPHPHTIRILDASTKKVIFSTGRLDYTNSSKPVVLPAGKYVVADTKYPWVSGNITVSSNQKSAANANLVVGAFYTTTNSVLDSKDNEGGVHPGWLGFYRTVFPENGFQILSEYNFHYAQCTYCPGGFWPDIKAPDHTLLVYSTSQPLSQALSKLAKMVWNNVYI